MAATLAASVLLAAVHADGVADGAFGARDGLRRFAGAEHEQDHRHDGQHGKQGSRHPFLLKQVASLSQAQI
jgi:hypothetical protein